MQSKKVWGIYDPFIKEFGNEFNILLKLPKEKLLVHINEKIVSLILKNREGKIQIKAGFDGEYGVALLEENQLTLS